ncbi:MAG: hypothetical protein OQK12_17285 [Motiliproteus sp.]|nr:hypothetical protein [Motiliproteus sp.]MCW9051230.1 hypothetical protein [Motiliproteus sp.]
MPVPQVLATHSSADIAEWMAIDLLEDRKFIERIERERELEASRKLSDAEKVEAFKQLFGGAN